MEEKEQLNEGKESEMFLLGEQRDETEEVTAATNEYELEEGENGFPDLHGDVMESSRDGIYIMSSEQAADLMKKVREFMRKEKPYLDPKFNMNKLCDALGINRTYLSAAINQNTGQRFETFINTYRIADAVELLSAKESSQYTLEYLATKVGFQSKSTFNRSFKQFTGINPSFFQKIILRDKSARKFFFDYFEDLKMKQFRTKE